MGNQPSSRSNRRSSRSSRSGAERAKKVIHDLNDEFKRSLKDLDAKLDDDHPASKLIDTVCGGYLYDHHRHDASYYSEDQSTNGSRSFLSEDDTFASRSRRDERSVSSASYSTYTYDSSPRRRRTRRPTGSFDTEDESRNEPPTLLSKPLASSFAKRCYFTKSGIGKTTQHYEGLTLTGNVVLMLASAMKLKGCPTICDEDLRRVEQTYPNQFSRLPDELLLSSGWRRISKYCHFSNKPIPDGIPFFHSKQRVHPSGGYYFLLANSVGMMRPVDVEPLTKDLLVLLETDFPYQCDAAPPELIQDPDQWTLVNKFCFFSGGPINTEEDVYYEASFDGNPIYMLAFLSPSLTPEELYKLNETGDEPGLKTIAEVQNVESVYDLTERDFDDLKLYHLGPCRALPQYILQPTAWAKVLPPHFMAARHQAMLKAEDGEEPLYEPGANPISPVEYQREVDQEGAFHDETSVPMDEASADMYSVSLPDEREVEDSHFPDPESPKLDPPDDEPPSLKKGSMEEARPDNNNEYYTINPGEPSVSGSAFFQEDAEEKKTGIEPEPRAASGEDDFIPIKRDGYSIGGPRAATTPKSTASVASVDSHQSETLREAQEILKRNRRRKAELAMKHSQSSGEVETSIQSSLMEAESVATWENGTWDSSDLNSGISSSSDWDGGEVKQSSKRALVLKMAKARMHNKDFPSKEARVSSPIDEEDGILGRLD